MATPPYITANDLDRWAERDLDARGYLPELVSRLIVATVPREDLRSYTFVSGVEVHRSGFDGTVVTIKGTEFVPEGLSYWETGVSSPEGKANDDYNKRVEQHLDRLNKGETDDFSRATFVALSARDWHEPKPAKQPKKAAKKAAKKAPPKKTGKPKVPTLGREGWTRAREIEGHFAGVRALDSAGLEDWLRYAPAVTRWLADLMGNPIPGAYDVGSYWEQIGRSLRAPLLPSVLLASRGEAVSSIRQWAEGGPSDLTVRAHSPQELTAFICAWCASLHDLEKSSIQARAIIVDDPITWGNLVLNRNPMLLIASSKLKLDDHDISKALAAGHSVLRQAAIGRLTAGGSSILLERIRQSDLAEALQASGVDRIEATKLARESGGTFTILRRIFSNHVVSKNPAWANDEALASMLLAGSWEDEREADQRVVSSIAGLTYSTLRTTVNRWSLDPEDPPVSLVVAERGRRTNCWRFHSTLDAWQFLHGLWSPEVLARFSMEAIAVLCDDDPGLTLPPDERYMAPVREMYRTYSEPLRKGIAQILAAGAARESESTTTHSTNFQELADHVVSEVLSAGVSWRRWASLSAELPFLLEASPDQVLSAMESDLDSAAPQLVALMNEESGGITGRTYHAGVLWALETAAWSPENLERASTLLIRLAEADPGGGSGNRPLESAKGIFFSRRSQSIADADRRLAILADLQQDHQDEVWKLLKKLVPNVGRALIWPSARPAYRDWAAVSEEDFSEEDFSRFIDGIGSLLVAGASDQRKWLDLLDLLASLKVFSSSAYASARDGLMKEIQDQADPELRKQWWNRLHVFIRDHTRFSEDEWSFTNDEIEGWRTVLASLTIQDPVTEVAPLFSDEALDYTDEILTYAQQEQKLLDSRKAAVRRIWDALGAEGLASLMRAAENPYGVGWAIGKELPEECFTEMIPSWLDDADPKIANGVNRYLCALIGVKGLEWSQSLPLDTWSDEQISCLALAMPISHDTWAWMETKSAASQASYWSRVNAWSSKELPAESVSFGADRMRGAGRSWDSLHFVMSADSVTKNGIVAPIVSALNGILISGEAMRSNMDGYRVQEAIKILQRKVDELGLVRVSDFEFSFLQLLDRRNAVPVMLYKRLSTDAQFYVDTLAKLYRPTAEDDSSEEGDTDGSDPILEEGKEYSEEEKQQAAQVYRLLEGWGFSIECYLDGSSDALTEWIRLTRGLAKTARLLLWCDLKLGEAFARSPAGIDGALPHEFIRDAIEKIRSKDIERGLSIGLHNLRRTYSKELYEGGDQERNLAARFETYADLCKRWPRTRGVLLEIKKGYLKDAKKADERAKGRR